MSSTTAKEDDKQLVGCHDNVVAKKSDSDGTNVSKQDQQQQQQQQQQQGRFQRRILTSKTVFVTGIAPGIAQIHLEKLFTKFGTVQRLDIKTSNKTGARFCFVEMDSIEHAQKAMDNLNGRTLLHKRLVVLPAHEKSGIGDQSNSTLSSSSSSNMDPARERRLVDQKIQELKNKIKLRK